MNKNECCTHDCNQGRDCPERRISERRAAPQPVDAAQAVKYRFVTFNGPAVNAAGMNLKYNDNGTITAWPITDLSITKDAP